MASYSGPLTEMVVVKIDPLTKARLAQQAKHDQTNLSAVTRRAIKAYLATCQVPTNEVQHAA